MEEGGEGGRDTDELTFKGGFSIIRVLFHCSNSDAIAISDDTVHIVRKDV